MYKVEVGHNASKFIRKLDELLKSQIVRKLRELEHNPRPIGYKHFRARTVYIAFDAAITGSFIPSETINCWF